MYRVSSKTKHRRKARSPAPSHVYLVTLRGPAMEYRDVRAGESPYDQVHKEVRARSEKAATRKARRWADELGEGLVIVDVERTHGPVRRRKERG